MGLFLLTLLLAIPPGLLVASAIQTSLGRSLAAETALTGVNPEWWQEFEEQASGLAGTFSPNVIGFAAVLDNLSRFLDNHSVPSPIFWLSAAYLLIWIFVAGGVIDRLARDRATRAHGFFAACGVFFFRFLRLGVVAGLVYTALFLHVHKWLLVDLYGWATRDMTVERTAFFLNLGLYAVFGALLLACNLVFDYAKIRAVVEDRRSMLGALVAGARFVARNPAACAGLYLLDGVTYVVVLAVYALVAPGADTAWTGFVISQLYLLARMFVKLLFLASQTALFQSLLAHATYTAAPVPVWPESPAVESVANTTAAR